MNNTLIELGCELVVKEAKNGYAVSYQYKKKAVMNWVFRKAGVYARIYGDNAGKYQNTIHDLPRDMQELMTSSRDCKRLINPEECSDACVQGIIYSLIGETYKKCRYDGMYFLLTNQRAKYITDLVCAEVNIRRSLS
ncbi:MAG: hypothetical protein PHX51_00105 [Clostridia bacterium]|nr:hypothetical protein [Clostridia bacterium]